MHGSVGFIQLLRVESLHTFQNDTYNRGPGNDSTVGRVAESFPRHFRYRAFVI